MVRPVLAAAAVLVAAGLRAAPAPEAGDGLPTGAFAAEVSVTLVQVPVEVERGGKPVTGLAAVDFEVTSSRRRLPIVGFDVVDLHARAAGPVAAPEIPAAATRQLLFFFDFALSDARRLVDGIDAAAELAAGGLAPSDRLAVAAYLPSGDLAILLPFTTDRSRAVQTLAGLRRAITGGRTDRSLLASGPLGDPAPGGRGSSLLLQRERTRPRNFAAELLESVGAADGGRAGGLLQELLAELAAIEQHAVTARAIDHVRDFTASLLALTGALDHTEGRKFLILWSEGFSTSIAAGEGGSSLLRNLEITVSTLRKTGWILHGVNVGGARAGFVADGTFFLAHETGGELIEGTGRMASGLAAALERQARGYLLAVEVDVPADGAYHPLRVRMRSRDAAAGARLRHRPGFFAPRAEPGTAPAAARRPRRR